MKIYYIGMKYDYGNPTRGLSFEHYNFYDSLVKMNNGAHTIIYFPFDEIMASIGKDAMNEKLKKDVMSEKPDLCFFFLFTDEIFQDTIREITAKSGSITFNWFADDHWRFYNYSKYWAPLFHWVSTTDSQAVKKYERIGYKNVIKSQWAANHFLYRFFDSISQCGAKYKTAFIGQPHSNRKQFIQRIQRRGISVECFGNGWPNGRIDQENIVELFSCARINLNLTKGSGYPSTKSLIKLFVRKSADGRYSFYGPCQWADNLTSFFHMSREQIKGRNFEIPACGGFILTSDADNLRDYYEDGKEIVIYGDFNDLVSKIRYYLCHDDERKKIARAGYERTLREHTYEKRFNELFARMGFSP